MFYRKSSWSGKGMIKMIGKSSNNCDVKITKKKVNSSAWDVGLGIMNRTPPPVAPEQATRIY